MFRKTWVWWSLALALGLAVLVGIVLFRSHSRPGIEAGHYRQIQLGMTEGDITALLGQPHVNFDPLDFTVFDPCEAEGTLSLAEPGSVYRFVDNSTRTVTWSGGKKAIDVQFDASGKAIGKALFDIETSPPHQGLLDRLCDLLGW